MTVGSGVYLSPSEQDPLKQNAAIRQVIEGRSNAVGTFTLSTGTTTTTVTAVTCGPQSIILFDAQTANAAAAKSTTFVTSTSVSAGTFVVTHSSTDTTDRTFAYEARG